MLDAFAKGEVGPSGLLVGLAVCRFFGQDPIEWLPRFEREGPMVRATLIAAMDLLKSRER